MRVSVPLDLVAAPFALALTKLSTIGSLLLAAEATPRRLLLSLPLPEVNLALMPPAALTVVVITVLTTRHANTGSPGST